MAETCPSVLVRSLAAACLLRPAFVPRIGATPAEVVRLIVDAGGIASLAHPGLLGQDELIPGMVDAGMQAIEVYHPEHPSETVAHYQEVAARYRLAITGGSDYHALDAHEHTLGRVTLPTSDFERLEAIAGKTWRPHVEARRVNCQTRVQSPVSPSSYAVRACSQSTGGRYPSVECSRLWL